MFCHCNQWSIRVGKISACQDLAHRLGDAVALHFDDYSPRYCSNSRYPAGIAKWIADGAYPSAWETPQLVQDLRALRQGKSITFPGHKEISKPTTFILRALGRRKPLVFSRNERILRPATYIVLEEPPTSKPLLFFSSAHRKMLQNPTMIVRNSSTTRCFGASIMISRQSTSLTAHWHCRMP
jgi:hypothetical protein